MDRKIVAFRQDQAGEWVAQLECGHSQHVRHDPPWQERPWVLEAVTRNARVGTALWCNLCHREGPRTGYPLQERGSPAE